MLDKVIKGKVTAPPRLIVYGQEGIGKSTFAASAPSPIFVQTEEGLNQISCDKFPLCRDYETLIEQMFAVAHEDHDYLSFVMDTADWAERLIWTKVAKQENKESIDHIGYNKGYQFALDYWKDIVTGLDAIRSRGMAVIILAHSQVDKFDDPEQQSYHKYSLRLHKYASAYLTEWADAVLFAMTKTHVVKVGTGFNERHQARPVGKDGGDRIIRTVGSPTCVAKNRYQMPFELPLQWASVAEYLS